MSTALRQLAQTLQFDSEAQRDLRLRFGLACVQRVEAWLEDPQAHSALAVFQNYLAGTCSEAEFATWAERIRVLANQHRGSASIDGSHHAAVSATYALANALQGKALEAADYAAYAQVYAYGGYAVRDPDAFSAEYAWQHECLQTLAAQTSQAA